MGVQSSRTDSLSEVSAVSPAPTFLSARDYALSLEKVGRSKGLTVPEARQEIAREVRVGVGTIERVIRDRVKRTDEKLRDKLQALLIRKLEAQIARLTNELEKARRTRGLHSAQHIREVEAYLSKASQLLNGSA